ncbi:MAG: iron-sulfur cluster assembly accessory protein [Candidatus Omnitrophica bacterium]|nr:iron-sulfur cluster assembly accessory protein [Candidatus Omnitrophota bacterium]
MVNVTTQAAQEIKRLLDEQKEPGITLRVAVKGGGCSGLSYALGFDKQLDGDKVYESSGIKVIVDPQSDPYLDGATLEFVDGLEGRGFKFTNPNAEAKKGSCGCGESSSSCC